LNCIRKYILLGICLLSNVLYSQRLQANGGMLLKAEITLGNQNQWLKIGAFGFGVLNYGDASIESGVSFASYQFFKRHIKKRSGIAYSYEVFALAGVGKNTNLLGSSVSEMNSAIIFDSRKKGGFNGLGFGFGKDYLPKDLKSYGIRSGQFIMRFSNATHSIHTVFSNDFKFGTIFNGERTDYATTGSLTVGVTDIRDLHRVYQAGIAVELFTPQPDYSRSPRNSINSDDGRKNVWFTLPPFKELFYANLYAFGTYQDEHYQLHSKIGVNSQWIGAYIQNTLHDGFGLNPRFPWKVDEKDQLFFEITGSVIYRLEETYD